MQLEPEKYWLGVQAHVAPEGVFPWGHAKQVFAPEQEVHEASKVEQSIYGY